MATQDDARGTWDEREFIDDLNSKWDLDETDLALRSAKFVNQLNNKELGMLGEVLAASFLEDAGLYLLERNYRCDAGEADLIAFDESEGTVVLVEVKTRRCSSEADPDRFPEEAIDRKKQQRYRKIAACYLAQTESFRPVRFDAVGIYLIGGSCAQAVHLKNAFVWETEQR